MHDTIYDAITYTSSLRVIVNNSSLIVGKSVLELGAGYMALPSMVCVKLNAKKVTITDFPSSDILDNIWKVLEINEYSKNCSEV